MLEDRTKMLEQALRELKVRLDERKKHQLDQSKKRQEELNR